MKTIIKFFLYVVILHIFLAGCRDTNEDELDTTIVTTDNTATTAPVIAEVTAVTTPTNDTTPDYTFSSDEAGTITYGGSCSSGTTHATIGNNSIIFISLSDGTYSDCTIKVTDSAGNESNILTITTFTVSSSDNSSSDDSSSSGSGVFVVVGDSGSIVRSTDNGSNWDNVTSPTANNLSGVTYGNNTFVADGYSGNIVRSTDNGSSWDNATSPTSNTLWGVGF